MVQNISDYKWWSEIEFSLLYCLGLAIIYTSNCTLVPQMSLPNKNHSGVEKSHENWECGLWCLPDAAERSHSFWIWGSSPVLYSHQEEVGDHEATNDDLTKEHNDK